MGGAGFRRGSGAVGVAVHRRRRAGVERGKRAGAGAGGRASLVRRRGWIECTGGGWEPVARSAEGGHRSDGERASLAVRLIERLIRLAGSREPVGLTIGRDRHIQPLQGA